MAGLRGMQRLRYAYNAYLIGYFFDSLIILHEYIRLMKHTHFATAAMTNLLKTLLHLLPVVVLCTTLAACTQPVSDSGFQYGSYHYGSGVASGAGSMLD